MQQQESSPQDDKQSPQYHGLSVDEVKRDGDDQADRFIKSEARPKANFYTQLYREDDPKNKSEEQKKNNQTVETSTSNELSVDVWNQGESFGNKQKLNNQLKKQSTVISEESFNDRAPTEREEENDEEKPFYPPPPPAKHQVSFNSDLEDTKNSRRLSLKSPDPDRLVKTKTNPDVNKNLEFKQQHYNPSTPQNFKLGYNIDDNNMGQTLPSNLHQKRGKSNIAKDAIPEDNSDSGSDELDPSDEEGEQKTKHNSGGFSECQQTNSHDFQALAPHGPKFMSILKKITSDEATHLSAKHSIQQNYEKALLGIQKEPLRTNCNVKEMLEKLNIVASLGTNYSLDLTRSIKHTKNQIGVSSQEPNMMTRESVSNLNKSFKTSQNGGSNFGDQMSELIDAKLEPVRDAIKTINDCLMNHASQVTCLWKLNSSLVEKFQESVNMFDRNKIGYNFVFMFAGPSHLNLDGDPKYKIPLKQLQHQEEYRLIKESIKKRRVEINVHKVHGTIRNMENIMQETSPNALHFSGHGVTRQFINEQHKKAKNILLTSTQKIEEIEKRGDALVMENADTHGEFLYEEDLKEMMKDVRLDFVFMATCHSEFAAKIFLNAGARHVIGIDQEFEIEDAAVLTFTQTFYKKIWAQGAKICQCFERAQWAVQTLHGNEQSSRFKLWIRDNHKLKKCPIYGNFQLGNATYKEAERVLSEMPPVVPHRFIGFKNKRQDLVTQFFTQHSDNKLCRITGFAGVGKSALARNTMHFVQERNFLSGGCVWVNARHCQEYFLFLKNLMLKLTNDRSHCFKSEVIQPVTPFNQSIDQSNEDNSKISAFENALNKILDQIKHQYFEDKFVFFFDNVDQLVSDTNKKESMKFIKLVKNIMQRCPNVKILLTMREQTGFMDGKVIQLKGMYEPPILTQGPKPNKDQLQLEKDQKKETWMLFEDHCGKLSKDEKLEFAKKVPDPKKFQGQASSKYRIDALGSHHLFELLGYNPQAIILTALQRKSNSNLRMAGIYQMIVEQKLMREDDDDLLGRQMSDSLAITLNVQVDDLQKWDKATYKFLHLLSFLPAFNYMSDFKSYWDDWVMHDRSISTNTDLQYIIAKLMDRNLIKVDIKASNEGLAEDYRIQMTDSIRTYLTYTLKNKPDNMFINFLLFKRYKNRNEEFYLKHKFTFSSSADFSNSTRIFKVGGREDSSQKNFERMLKNNDETMFQTALRSIKQWQQGDVRNLDDIEKQYNQQKIEMKRAQSLKSGKSADDINKDSSPSDNSIVSRMGFLRQQTDSTTSPMIQRLGLSLSKKMADTFYQEQWETSEQFILFLFANMIMIGRYNFMQTFFEELDIHLDDSDSLNELPVTNLFLGNIWRLSALCEIKNFEHRRMNQEEDPFHDGEQNYHEEFYLNPVDFDQISARLKFAQEYFQKDNSKWGLGLTDLLWARTYTLKKRCMDNFNTACRYYKSALDTFQDIHHYRATYMTQKNLIELEQQYLSTMDGHTVDEINLSLQKLVTEHMTQYNKNFLFFQNMKAKSNVPPADRLLFKIITTERGGEMNDSLDLEVVIRDKKGTYCQDIGLRFYNPTKPELNFELSFVQDLPAPAPAPESDREPMSPKLITENLFRSNTLQNDKNKKTEKSVKFQNDQSINIKILDFKEDASSMASDLIKVRQESARMELDKLARLSKMSENEQAFEPKVKQVRDTLKVSIHKSINAAKKIEKVDELKAAPAFTAPARQPLNMAKSVLETCPAKTNPTSKLTSSRTGTEMTNIVDMSPTSLSWDGDELTRQQTNMLSNVTIDVAASSDKAYASHPMRTEPGRGQKSSVLSPKRMRQKEPALKISPKFNFNQTIDFQNSKHSIQQTPQHQRQLSTRQNQQGGDVRRSKNSSTTRPSSAFSPTAKRSDSRQKKQNLGSFLAKANLVVDKHKQQNDKNYSATIKGKKPEIKREAAQTFKSNLMSSSYSSVSKVGDTVETPAARPSSVKRKKIMLTTASKQKNSKRSPDSTIDQIGQGLKAKSAEKSAKMKQPKLVLGKPIQFDSRNSQQNYNTIQNQMMSPQERRPTPRNDKYDRDKNEHQAKISMKRVKTKATNDMQ